MKTAPIIKRFSSRTIAFILTLAAAVTASGRSLPVDSAVRKGVLPNGLTYFIRHNSQTPGQADFYLANKVGSIFEKPDQRGLAHFLEHLAFNGTKHFPGGNGADNSVRGWCERHGIKFGADLNAFTSVDRTVYNILNVPVSKSGVADTCLMIMRDWAGDMLLRADEIDAERGVVREEWRARRSRFASTRMMEEALPVIYAGAPYADCLPIGHIEVIDTFPPDRVREFYKDWYRPDLQAVVVVGDIDVDAIEKKIYSLFESLQTLSDAPSRVLPDVGNNESMIVYTQADAEQPTLNLSLYMKRDSDPAIEKSSFEEFAEEYKSKLALFILRQRLASLSQEARPRIMSASVRDNGFYITPAKEAFCVSIGLLPDNPQAGIDAVLEVLEKARMYGFTDSELEHAKIQHAVNIEHKVDIRNKTRNGEYVKYILNHYLDNAPLIDVLDESLVQAQLADSLTLNDVNLKAAQIINDANQVLIVFGPQKYDGNDYEMPSAEQFESWITQAQGRHYEDTNDNSPVDTNFMTDLPEKGTILRKRSASNGYTEYLLNNGINVSVRPSGLEPNRLTINMFRKGGMSFYPDDDIVTLRLLNNIVRESGAADFDYLTLEKKRRGKALRVEPYIDAEVEGVKGVCSASDLKTWLEVAHLYLTRPRLDSTIFVNHINKQKSLLKNRDANPNVAYKDSLRKAVYGESERVRPLGLDNIDKADLQRMYQIYNERFADLSGMNLIITGDVREDELEELLCQYVASLPGSGVTDSTPEIGPNVVDLMPGKRNILFSKNMQTPSALTDIVYSTPIEFTADNDLRLDVLSQLLKAIFTEEIREEKGGSYGVSVNGSMWSIPSEGASLTVNFRCDPGRYDELIPLIDRALKRIAENGPSEAQLQKISEYELKNYERAVLTNGWWEYVRYNQLLNGVDFNEGYAQRVIDLNAADIQEIAAKLINSGNRIQVTMKAK